MDGGCGVYVMVVVIVSTIPARPQRGLHYSDARQVRSQKAMLVCYSLYALITLVYNASDGGLNE